MNLKILELKIKAIALGYTLNCNAYSNKIYNLPSDNVKHFQIYYLAL
jgi:hypothetical protein